MYKSWTEPETRILMNWQEVIENPDEFNHGVAIVETFIGAKPQKAIILMHTPDNKQGLILASEEEEHQVYFPSNMETFEQLYHRLENSISIGHTVWRGKATPNCNASKIRMIKRINNAIDQARLPDYITTNNGHVDLDDQTKAVLKATFKQLFASELAEKLQ